VPTTQGYGHIARAKAIISELESRGIAYGVLTDKKGESFLINNDVHVHAETTLYGISYCFKNDGSEKSLDPLMTFGKLLIDTPQYFLDYVRVIKQILRHGYDVVVNDVNLQITRIPAVNVVNILHYTLPQGLGDVKRVFGGLQSLFYEGLIEPVINASSVLTDRFSMDLRTSHIDYDHTFPPIVSKTTKSRDQVRNELGVGTNERLIVDGRKNPPLELYKWLANEYRLNFLVRSCEESCEHLKTKSFIPNMVDYIAAADLFVTSPGFSSLSEGVVYGTPMLIDTPQFHFEGLKNLAIAQEEGYGRPIRSLSEDIVRDVDETHRIHRLENGLPYMIDILERLGRQTPLLHALIRNQ
jgi:hypothetical protein